MSSLLITPPAATDWRVDLESLAVFLRSRWSHVEMSRGSADQRMHLWTWDDHGELWVPSRRDCVWLELDWAKVSAVAVWLAAGNPDLILCDEGYNFDIALRDRDEAQVLELLAGH